MIQHSPVGLIGQLASNAGNFATGQAVFDQNLQASHLQQQAAAQAAQDQLRRDEMAQQNDQFNQSQQQQNDLVRYRAQEQQQGERERFANQQALQEQQYRMQGANQQQLAGIQGGNAMEREKARLNAQEGMTSDRLDERYYRDKQQADGRDATLQARQDIAAATDRRLRDLATQRGNNGQDPEFKLYATQSQRMGQHIDGVRADLAMMQRALSHWMSPADKILMQQRFEDTRATLDSLVAAHQAFISSPPQLRQQSPQPGGFDLYNVPNGVQPWGNGPQTTQPSMQAQQAAPPPPAAAPPPPFGGDRGFDQPAPAQQLQRPPQYQQPSAIGYAPQPGQAPAVPRQLTPQQIQQIGQLKAAGYNTQQIRAAMGL